MTNRTILVIMLLIMTIGIKGQSLYVTQGYSVSDVGRGVGASSVAVAFMGNHVTTVRISAVNIKSACKDNGNYINEALERGKDATPCSEYTTTKRDTYRTFINAVKPKTVYGVTSNFDYLWRERNDGMGPDSPSKGYYRYFSFSKDRRKLTVWNSDDDEDIMHYTLVDESEYMPNKVRRDFLYE